MIKKPVHSSAGFSSVRREAVPCKCTYFSKVIRKISKYKHSYFFFMGLVNNIKYHFFYFFKKSLTNNGASNRLMLNGQEALNLLINY